MRRDGCGGKGDGSWGRGGAWAGERLKRNGRCAEADGGTFEAGD